MSDRDVVNQNDATGVFNPQALMATAQNAFAENAAQTTNPVEWGRAPGASSDVDVLLDVVLQAAAVKLGGSGPSAFKSAAATSIKGTRSAVRAGLNSLDMASTVHEETRGSRRRPVNFGPYDLGQSGKASGLRREVLGPMGYQDKKELAEKFGMMDGSLPNMRGKIMGGDQPVSDMKLIEAVRRRLENPTEGLVADTRIVPTQVMSDIKKGDNAVLNTVLDTRPQTAQPSFIQPMKI